MKPVLLEDSTHKRYPVRRPTINRPLDLLLNDWLPDDIWPKDVIHITDCEACPRQVVLRIGGAEVTIDERKLAKRNYMFHCANQHHWDIYESFHNADLLLACEVSLHELHLLPLGWYGTLDMAIMRPDLCIGDIKSNHPNFIRYVIRGAKKDDMAQVRRYELFAGRALGTKQDPRLFYKDRGGQNESKEFVVPMPASWMDVRDFLPTNNLDLLTAALDDLPGMQVLCDLVDDMIDLEDTVRRWRQLGHIPDPLPRTFFYEESGGKPDKNGAVKPLKARIYEDQDWRCGYCDYANTQHCTPAAKTELGVWKLEDGRWQKMRTKATAAQREAARLWAASELGEAIEVVND